MLSPFEKIFCEDMFLCTFISIVCTSQPPKISRRYLCSTPVDSVLFFTILNWLKTNISGKLEYFLLWRNSKQYRVYLYGKKSEKKLFSFFPPKNIYYNNHNYNNNNNNNIYIYIYIYIYNSWNLDCDPRVSWSFLQNNNHLAVKKMKWIENRKNTVKKQLGFCRNLYVWL